VLDAHGSCVALEFIFAANQETIDKTRQPKDLDFDLLHNACLGDHPMLLALAEVVIASASHFSFGATATKHPLQIVEFVTDPHSLTNPLHS
jgi:hypothetical protein